MNRAARAVKLAGFLLALGVSFGFVGVVVAIGHATYFRLPSGVHAQDYVTLGRRQADSGLFAPVSDVDFVNVQALTPEVAWSYAIFSTDALRIRDRAGAEHSVESRRVSRNFFSALGVRAVAGRLAAGNGNAGAVVSAALWHRHYASAPDVVGEVPFVDGPPLPIVGVADPEFSDVFPEPADVWILDHPASVQARWTGLYLFGAPTPETTLPALRSLLAEYRFSGPQWRNDRIEVVPGIDVRPDSSRDTRQRLAWLAMVVALLLALAFMALADFMLADHAGRRQQYAVRLAMGATPADVFVETSARHAGWIVLTAGLSFLSQAYLADVVLALEPFKSAIGRLSLSSTLAGQAAGAVLLAAGFLASCTHVSRFVVRRSWAVGQGGAESASRGGRWTQTALLFSAAASLLAVASLAVRYAQDARSSLGFEHADTLMLGVFYPSSSAPRATRQISDALARRASAPSAARAEMLPLLGESIGPANRWKLSGRQGPEDPVFYRNRVGSGFFATLGLEPLAGRLFDGVSTGEAVLARTAAERLAGDIDAAVGMALGLVPEGTAANSAADAHVATVVGVVEDVRYGPYGEVPKLVAYGLLPETEPGGQWQDFWLVRDAGGNDDVVSVLQQLVGPGADVYAIGRPSDIFRERFLARRSVEVALAAAAAFAFVLSLAGVANALAGTVAGDARRIGIHLAVGATSTDLVRRYAWPALAKLLLAGAVLCGLVVVAGLFLPAFLAVIELPLALAALALLAVLCGLVVWLRVRRFVRAPSVKSLVDGLEV